MDEITLVRELGEEKRLPSPDRLAAARTRLMSEIDPPKRPRRWAALLAAAAATAIAAVTVPQIVTPNAQPPAPAPSVAPGPKLTPVAAFLDQAATAAENEPDVVPRGDQFLYLRFIEWGGDANEAWLSIDGRHDGWGVDQDGKYATIPGCAVGGDCRAVVRYRADMPTDPKAMVAWLRATARKDFGSDSLDAVTKYLGTVSTRFWMRPAQRAALYRAIGLIDGVRLVEGVTDSRGRDGVGVAWVPTGQTSEVVVWVFDPKTFRMLGTPESSIDEIALVDRARQKA
ncbi:CU044_5270 family protein [Actinoplanes sichuanensis]|uniref:CU044_5270 family protein n=1 Tax=Actinoplanes sichuanensis TaxID=512349 RepID=A0ABW4A428_9ACTN|nr:CU044_5270 family protein [Actinoplanes sichuanensis]BEL10548.1 CU044_5270 family protein [Actinoplanes sichuanensis]